VRGVLVDDDQAIAGFGDDIGLGHLPARHAERMLDRLGHRLGSPVSARATGGAMTPAS
jgi:hypothetical protein